LGWVEHFYVENPQLYASTIDSSLWTEGEETARSISNIMKTYRVSQGRREVHLLDVPCGMGRVSIPLAKLGFDVTGIDISAYYLRIAREKSKKSGVSEKTTYMIGRMEQMNRIIHDEHLLSKFDAAISIHTSLGYGTEHEDQCFLKGLREGVKEGGLFIITARRNKPNITRYLASSHFQETDESLVLQNNKYVEASSRLYTRWRFFRKKARTGNGLSLIRDIETHVRLYSSQELVILLGRTGWKVIEQAESINTRNKPISEESQGIYILSRAE
jgi:2-polyprenyl-3-methyl-5-hydroxy-6-metoxy-1,4-benzoquinol methylase